MYIYHIRTSEKTRASTASYGGSLPLLYVDNIWTSQETVMGLQVLLYG
jgi:hypothetical protein